MTTTSHDTNDRARGFAALLERALSLLDAVLQAIVELPVRCAHLLVPLAASLMLLAGQLAAASPGAPQINLFPTTVVEELRVTADTTEALEKQARPVIKTLQEQIALYQASKCEGNAGDAGCDALKKSLADSYKAMLDTVDAALPGIERSMSGISRSVGGRIVQELGLKSTPRDLQRLLDGSGTPERGIRDRAGRKRLGMTALLRSYRQMIAMGPAQGEPMAVLAADLYLDAREAGDEIEQIRGEIARAKVMIEVNRYLPKPTEEMVATVGSIKALLFGEVDAVAIPDDRIQGHDPDGFDDSRLTIR